MKITQISSSQIKPWFQTPNYFAKEEWVKWFNIHPFNPKGDWFGRILFDISNNTYSKCL